MGKCHYQGRNGFRCTCDTGQSASLSTENWLADPCDNCEHAMGLHDDFGAANESVPETLRTSQRHLSQRISPRLKLVDGIIERAELYKLIIVRGTPACGKSVLVDLVANELLRKTEWPVFVLNGWTRWDVESVGWHEYLRKKTGISGSDWPTTKAYLLFDEAQESYWDGTMWASLFKTMIPFFDDCPKIILFASYGFPGRGNAGFDPAKFFKTPVEFGPSQVIAMRSEDSLDDDEKLDKIGILLNEAEASDMMDRCGHTGGFLLAPDLRERFYHISGGHAGCLAALIGVLGRTPELDEHRGKHSGSFDLGIVQDKLLGSPSRLFSLLRNTPFCRGMPKTQVLQIPTVARIMKQAVASDGVHAHEFPTPPEHQVLEKIWRNGWLDVAIGDYYRFPSFIHRWFCSYMLFDNSIPSDIPFNTPLELIFATIRLFSPRNLSEPPRSTSGMMVPLEDLFQKEFYRTFYALVDGQALISPEFVVKSGKGGGAIDFLLSSKKWGFELVRSPSKLSEHMRRFQAGGTYHSLITSSLMTEYLVLNFTISIPQKKHPEYGNNLYHIVFSSNYRDVTIVEASNLEKVLSFTLTENPNPLS